MHHEQPQWPVTVLCRVLQVARSGYQAWLGRQQQPPARQQTRQQAEARLRLHIHGAHRKGRGYYGSPRVHAELREQGLRTSRKRVARLMQQEGLVGRSRARRRVVTTDSRHALPVAENLLARRFAPQEVARPNRFWAGDITYVRTREGWIYLATVSDLFSRRVLGWAMQDTLDSNLVEVAWQRALATRGWTTGGWTPPAPTAPAQAAPGEAPALGPVLYHSDRGSQYAGHRFQRQLAQCGTQCSMSGTGNCYDNAVSESFFGTFKAELLQDQPNSCFASKAVAMALTGDYIDNYYNPLRRHSTLGFQSPVAFELAYQVNLL